MEIFTKWILRDGRTVLTGKGRTGAAFFSANRGNYQKVGNRKRADGGEIPLYLEVLREVGDGIFQCADGSTVSPNHEFWEDPHYLVEKIV